MRKMDVSKWTMITLPCKALYWCSILLMPNSIVYTCTSSLIPSELIRITELLPNQPQNNANISEPQKIRCKGKLRDSYFHDWTVSGVLKLCMNICCFLHIPCKSHVSKFWFQYWLIFTIFKIVVHNTELFFLTQWIHNPF